MKRRIVIYQARSFSADEALLAAIESATGADREAAAKLLKTRRAVYLNDLDEAGVEEVRGLLEARHLDYDLEPMAPPADKVEWLSKEIPKWVKRGLLGPAMANSVRRGYGLEAAAPVAVPKRDSDPRVLVRAVLTLGAILVGLGLILFVASNWERIPDVVKIGGSLALTLITLHVAHRLANARAPHPLVAGTLFLIALFGIGGVVILIAQTYHVVADSYRLPLIWGALCVPVALLQRFKPALYAASGLWLWSYWLYHGSHDELLWLYPFLLLGFLLPYGLLTGDKLFYRVHLGVLMVALVSTVATADFWLCSVWVGALILLRLRYREPLYDWMLLVGFLCWHFTYLIHFDQGPNLFYALPVAYFLYRAWKESSNWLMIAAIANAWIWFLTFSVSVVDRFDLAEPAVTGVLLWFLASGLLLFGIGMKTRRLHAWLVLSAVLRYGGAALSALMVYVLSFRFHADETAFFDSPIFMGTALTWGAMGIILAVPSLVAEATGDRRRWGPVALVCLTGLSLVLAAVLAPAAGVHVVLFNLILFLLALALMLRGHRKTHIGWYNAGIGLFVVLIVSRYFDTFVDLLPRSVFFVLGGVFLIVWAILVDRQRKRRSKREEKKVA